VRKAKQKPVFFYGTCAFFLLLFTVFLIVTQADAEPNMGKSFRMLWQELFRPKDYFNDLVSEPIDLGIKGQTKKFKFENKYVGLHFIELVVEQFDRDWLLSGDPKKKYNFRARLELKLYSEEQLIYHRILGEKPRQAMGLGPTPSGAFVLADYQCPDDLPVKKNIVGEITVVETDTVLTNEYGPTTFVIRKVSDE